MLITGFDIDDAEFIGEEFAFVVGVEDVDLGDRAGQVAAEGGVEKMDEQVAVVLGAQQGFEDTFGLGVDRVVYAQRPGGRGNGALRGARAPGPHAGGTPALPVWKPPVQSTSDGWGRLKSPPQVSPQVPLQAPRP